MQQADAMCRRRPRAAAAAPRQQRDRRTAARREAAAGRRAIRLGTMPGSAAGRSRGASSRGIERQQALV
jgi:hypothetical protein